MSAHPEPSGIEPAAVTSGNAGSGMLVRLSLVFLLDFCVWGAWYAVAVLAILVYMLFFQPTLALVNSITCRHLGNDHRVFPYVRVFATVGWIIAGFLVGSLELSASTGVFTVTGIAGLLLAAYSLTRSGLVRRFADIARQEGQSAFPFSLSPFRHTPGSRWPRSHFTASATTSSSFWKRYTSTRLRRRSSARTRSRCFVWIVRGADVFVSSLVGSAVFAATDRTRAAIR